MTRKTDDTSLAISPQTLASLEDMAKRYALAELNCKGRFERAVMLAQGMQSLRTAVQPLMQHIIPLMGSNLGFRTDRDPGTRAHAEKGPYSVSVVTECLIEAVLRGVYPVGNEFNIIAGNCYITKNGYGRLVSELPGLTDLKLMPGVPRILNGGAIVPFKATWKIQGKPDQLEREIPIRMDRMTGADALLGKATRKILAAVHSQVTGSVHSLEDSRGEDVPQGFTASLPSRTEQVAAQLEGRASRVPGTISMELWDRIGARSNELLPEVCDRIYRDLGIAPNLQMSEADGQKILAALDAAVEETENIDVGQS